MKCSYCSREEPGKHQYAIHRDGLGIGPEMPLCSQCVTFGGPTCEEIWAHFAKRGEAMVRQRLVGGAVLSGKRQRG